VDHVETRERKPQGDRVKPGQGLLALFWREVGEKGLVLFDVLLVVRATPVSSVRGGGGEGEGVEFVITPSGIRTEG